MKREGNQARAVARLLQVLCVTGPSDDVHRAMKAAARAFPGVICSGCYSTRSSCDSARAAGYVKCCPDCSHRAARGGAYELG